jgi:hypothetical protein
MINQIQDLSVELRNNIEFLKQFIQRPIQRILEIGCYHGGSTQIWLEHFLSDDGFIVCIDPFNVSDEDPFGDSDLGSDPNAETIFWNTVRSIQKPNQTIELRRGRSYHELASLVHDKQQFDLIYIDGNHTSASVISDACMSYGLLFRGGIMLFDDYFWRDNFGVNGQSLNLPDWPKMGIDAFTTLFHTNIEILFINYQYAIRKW